MLPRAFLIACLYVTATTDAPAEPTPALARPELVLQVGHTRAISSLTWASASGPLVTASADGTVKVWDVASASLRETLQTGARTVTWAGLSPRQATGAALVDQGEIRVWDVDRPGSMRPVHLPRGTPAALCWMREGVLAAAGRTGEGPPWVLGWDVRRHVVLWEISVACESVDRLQMAESGTRLLVSGQARDGSSVLNCYAVSKAPPAPQFSASRPQCWFSSAAMSPDGKQLLVTGNDLHRTGYAWVWALGLSMPARTVRCPQSGSLSGAFTPDSRQIVLAFDRDGGERSFQCVQRWELASGRLLGERRYPELYRLEFTPSPDSRRIAVRAGGDAKGNFQLWDTRTLRVSSRFSDFASDVEFPEISPDGQRLAFSGADSDLLVWERETGRLRRLAPPIPEGCRSFQWTDNGKCLLTCETRDGHPEIIDAESGLSKLRCSGPRGYYTRIARSPDSSRLLGFATTSFEQLRFIGGHCLWDGKSGAPIRELPLTESLEFSASGRFICGLELKENGTEFIWPLRETGKHYDKTLCVWDRDGKLVRKIGPAEDFKLAPTSDILVFKDDGGIATQELVTGAIHRVSSRDIDFAISRDGGNLVTASTYDPVQVFDLATARLIRSLPPPKESISGLDLSPDGKTAAFGVGSGALLMYLEDGSTLPLAGKSSPGPRHIEFSRGGSYVSCRDFYGLQVWDARTGRQLVMARDCYWFSFSPDDRSLALQAADRTLRVYELRTGRERLALASFPTMDVREPSRWLAYTPDGRYDGSPGAGRYLRWRVKDRVLPASAVRPTRDLLEYTPWTFAERSADLDEARVEFWALPLWTRLQWNDAEGRDELMAEIRRLNRFDTVVLREMLRSVMEEIKDDPGAKLDFTLNATILNHYVFELPGSASVWPLTRERDGTIHLVNWYGGFGGGLGDPVRDFDQLRTRYPRRPYHGSAR